MKISVRELKRLISKELDEARFRATPPKRLRDVVKPVDVEANNTREAGEKAADAWTKQGVKGIDPMSIDVQPVQGGQPSSTGSSGKVSSPAIIGIGYGRQKVADDLQAKGYAVADDGWGQQIVYDPDHWQIGQHPGYGANPDGVMVDFPGGQQLVPKSDEAKKIFSSAARTASSQNRTAVSVDLIHDVWPGNLSDEVDRILGV